MMPLNTNSLYLQFGSLLLGFCRVNKSGRLGLHMGNLKALREANTSKEDSKFQGRLEMFVETHKALAVCQFSQGAFSLWFILHSHQITQRLCFLPAHITHISDLGR